MNGPAPNRCSATEWPHAQRCKHGHAFTTACLFPEHGTLPMCCREDRRFDETHQVVTMGYVRPLGVNASVPAGITKERLRQWHDYMGWLMQQAGIEQSEVIGDLYRAYLEAAPTAGVRAVDGSRNAG